MDLAGEKIVSSNWYVVGWDPALDHLGAVCLDQAGSLAGWWCMVRTQRDAKALGDRAILLPTAIKKIDDKLSKNMFRLAWLQEYFGQVLGKINAALPDKQALVYVALEDYAYAARGGHQIGEAGGILRIALLDQPWIRLRMYDPLSVKIFATGRGDTKGKELIREGLVAQWPGPYPWDHLPDDEVVGDLYDALTMAHMLHTELQLRAGLITLDQLTDHQRRIYLRTTKTHPVNCLDRQFSSKFMGPWPWE